MDWTDLVEATTLIVVSTVVQTVVISITLLVFILQFRSQEKAIKESSYQGLMGRYNDFISMLADKPELTRLLMSQLPGPKSGDVSKEDAAVLSHLVVAYGIIEEAYLLYAKKWIDEDNWQQWSTWLEALSKHPLFPRIHRAMAGTFDKRFEDHVSTKILKRNEQSRPSGY